MEEENNKLIAEFMGPDYTKRQIPDWAFSKYDFDTLKYGGYDYKTSWDWLMPVIDKITDMPEYPRYISETASIVSDGGIYLNPRYIECTYDDTVDFIKWYNLINS